MRKSYGLLLWRS